MKKPPCGAGEVAVAPEAIPLPKGLGSVTQVSASEVRIEYDSGPNALRPIGGSDTLEFNDLLLRAAVGTVWSPPQDQDAARRIAAVAAAMTAFKAKDEIEGMLAAQAVALHFGAMECLRRSVLPDQPNEIASKHRKDGANLARAMTDMLDALDRKRGKGPQVVRVERVVVHEGGQAIVGNVQAGAAAVAAAAQPVIGQEPPGPVLDMPATTSKRGVLRVAKKGRGER